jgi:hypothetical protein
VAFTSGDKAHSIEAETLSQEAAGARRHVRIEEQPQWHKL